MKRLSWIIQLSSQRHHKHHCKTEVLTDEEKGDVKIESETGMMWPQAKNCWQSSEAGRGKEVRKGFS